MTDTGSLSTPHRFLEPGVARISVLNWYGLKTLYLKEVRRFVKVQMQTVWAPAITTLLFLAIFTVALGRTGRTVMDRPFADFLAPGLIVMGMIQNAFANTSSSLLIGKVQGTIIDILMPPLSSGELLLAFVSGAVTRAATVGLTVWAAMLLWPGVHVTITHLWAVLYYGLMGSMLLSLLGILTGIWADKFDHAAAIGNFVIQPLSLLSGTFYTLDKLHGTWAAISHVNPFFYIIDGFRYGFLGQSDGPLAIGALFLLALNAILGVVAYVLMRRGWRLKA